jgi:hypothetical protein
MVEWIHSRTGATVVALAGVILVRMSVNATDVVESLRAGVRAWMWAAAPFELILHVEVFWLETLLALAAMIVVMWMTRDFSFRALVPLLIALFTVDLVAMLGADEALIVGGRLLQATQLPHLPVQGFDLLQTDAISVVFWNGFTLGIATLAALVGGRLLRRVTPAQVSEG